MENGEEEEKMEEEQFLNNDKFIKFIRLIMKAYIHTFILEEMNILLFLSNSKTESNCFR
jgi:hypothetical protein